MKAWDVFAAGVAASIIGTILIALALDPSQAPALGTLLIGVVLATAGGWAALVGAIALGIHLSRRPWRASAPEGAAESAASDISSVREAVVGVLAEQPATEEEIIDRTGLNTDRVRYVLGRLTLRGEAEKGNDRRWQLTRASGR